MILKLQWLVNIYTHPNQIPACASAPLPLTPPVDTPWKRSAHAYRFWRRTVPFCSSRDSFQPATGIQSDELLFVLAVLHPIGLRQLHWDQLYARDSASWLNWALMPLNDWLRRQQQQQRNAYAWRVMKHSVFLALTGWLDAFINIHDSRGCIAHKGSQRRMVDNINMTAILILQITTRVFYKSTTLHYRLVGVVGQQ